MVDLNRYVILVLLKENIWTIIEALKIKIHQYLRPRLLVINGGLKGLSLRFLFIHHLFRKHLCLRHLFQRLDPFGLILLILLHYLQNVLHKLCAVKRHSWTLNSRTRTLQINRFPSLPFLLLVNHVKLCTNRRCQTRLILCACLYIYTLQ